MGCMSEIQNTNSSPEAVVLLHQKMLELRQIDNKKLNDKIIFLAV